MLSIRVVDQREWRWVFITSGILLVLLVIPFAWAYGVAVPDQVFMGVLVNPIDGASYQAKMFQGYEGSWLFHLPFTPEQHQGVFLFTFYLALGHLARALNLAPILIFHTVRLLGAMFMFLAAYRFIADWTDDVTQRRLTWALSILGAGFGWIAIAAGYESTVLPAPPDILVLPEAFPFQSAYANAHFPWALAAALVIAHVLINKALDEEAPRPDFDVETIGLAAGSLLLVSISPFILVPLGAGYAALIIWTWRKQVGIPWYQIQWGLVVVIFGAPLAAYNAWAISEANPIFYRWMAQNLTLSPPVFDYLIAFGPLLLLAIPGIWGSRRVFDASDVFLLGWLVAGLLLLYAPVGLQRRFSMGLIFPMSIFAGRGLWRVLIPELAPDRSQVLIVAVFATFIPSTILALITPMVGSLQLIEQQGGKYFINAEEYQGYQWLSERPGDPLVLAAPDTSLFLPVYGLRVVYGHPYETLEADRRRDAVLSFYTGEDCDVVAEENVDYVIVGPRERQLARELGGSEDAICPLPDEPVFQSDSGDVLIYASDR